MFSFGTVRAWAYVNFDDYQIEHNGETFSASGSARVIGEYSRDDDCGYRSWEVEEVEMEDVSWYRYDKSTDEYVEEDTIPQEVIDALDGYCENASHDCDLNWDEEDVCL